MYWVYPPPSLSPWTARMPLLIDPFLTSQNEIDKLFDDLNADNIHIVYDGTADKSYTKQNPLVSKGDTLQGNKFDFVYNSLSETDSIDL